ncbi:MAG TPA: NADPH-dependent F420 reductase, partial [Polyangiales bacterium]|nr:NADPH-dependent F420 reductase [Polyangiales bacterium]
MKIAVVGGTGKEGHGVALRWLKAGHTIRIGSRDAAKARAKAEELRALVGGACDVEGFDNPGAVRDADVVLLSVPYAAHTDTLRSVQHALDGKVVIDITVPLQPPHVRRVFVPESKAAALETQAITEGRARVVAALHHVSSVHLASDHAIDCNVLVCSDDEVALQLTLDLMTDLCLRGIHAGP